MTETALPKKDRNSTIELLRIFMMLVIILHHYIVNSGVIQCVDSIVTSRGGTLFNAYFALCAGWGGKMAINVFLLITGYFMCRQEFKWKKVIGLYCLIKFYSLTIYLIFLLSGYEAFTLKECYKTVFNVSFEFGKGFVSSFIGLYFLVPFINKFISVLDENAFEKMLLILFVMFMGISTFL